MNSKMTPCEKLGYKVGDEFEVISHYAFKKGQVVTLHEDDGTECPLFAGDGGGAGVFDGVECSFATLNKQVRKIANKLKPAKQALADAIHQNGGWEDGAELAWFQGNLAKNECNEIWFGNELSNPEYNPTSKSYRSHFSQIVGRIKADKFANWHQCILSRDEYFTAYPEQVKVEAENETEHEVEVEMKSESEVTIKVGDWHKNGEFPPAGDVCEAEYNTTPSVWESVRVVGFDDGECVFRWISGGNAGLIGAYSHQKDFRPLRSEREKAIDEMVDVITDDRYAPLYVIKIATKLYDAGYRKEAK